QPLPLAAPARPAELLRVSLPADFGGASAAASGAAGQSMSAVQGGAAGGKWGSASVSTPPGVGDRIDVAVMAHPKGSLRGLVTVSIPENLVEKGAELRFVLPAEVADAAEGAAVKVSDMQGGKLPSWLRYLPRTRTFVAAGMPRDALPFRVLVRMGRPSWVVLLTEGYGS